MELKKEELFEAIKQISAQNLITKEETKEIISEAVKKAFYNKYDPDADLELIIDEDKNTFELYNNSKLVVSDKEFNEEYNAIEVKLSQVKKKNPKIKEGDSFKEKVDFSLYSRGVAQQIKQMFTQTIREKKKVAIYAKHKGLKGEMIKVVATAVTNTYATFQMEDGTTAFMPAQLRNPNIKIAVGQSIEVYVEDVLEDSREAQVIVSNGSKELIKRILEEEVPEISSGVVEIVGISRQPGIRSKVAVRSTQENVDAVGAIIGARGVRINAIVAKLDGEKLDIIPFSDDVNVYIANALSPARVASVMDKLDSDDKPIQGQKTIIVPNVHQTLAIGRQGSNVRLAVELVKHRIDVISIDQAKEREIDFTLNVGLTQEEINTIESGERLTRAPRQVKSFEDNFSASSIEFDDSIETFTSEMNDEDHVISDFDIDDNLFSDEDIKKMEADFEFDEFSNSEFNETEEIDEKESDK